MRFVVVGAGAIGGTVAAALAVADHEVVVIARGAHLAAIQERGLRFRSPGQDIVVALDAVGHPAEVRWRGDEVILLATKSQQTPAALADLVVTAPAPTPPPGAEANALAGAARAEGEIVLRAAGIDWGEADPAVSNRRDGVYRLTPIEGERRAGGSTWQSLARGTGNIEVDHLNGEIVFLSRLHGAPAPVNEALQRAATAAALAGVAAGSVSPTAIMDVAVA